MGFDEGLRIYCCYYQVVLSDMQNNSFCEGMFSKEERFKISERTWDVIRRKRKEEM